jgi:hypothetical protein
MIVGIGTIASAGCVDSDLCPIMHEKFNEVDLEIATGKSFLPRKPEISVATLSCGHKFSVLGIMYQFVLVGMRCPLCRAGVDGRAQIADIPNAWRECMKTKNQSMRTEEQRELNRLDEEASLQLQRATEQEDSISTFLTEDSLVHMTVYMFGESDMATVHYHTYELTRMSGGMLFTSSTDNISDIMNRIHDTRSVSVRITVHSRTMDGVPVELSNTSVILLEHLCTADDIVFHTSTSLLRFVMHEEGGLQHIQWFAS